jgi:hypothetical protein
MSVYDCKRTQEGIAGFRRLLESHEEARIVLESTGNLWVNRYSVEEFQIASRTHKNLNE